MDALKQNWWKMIIIVLASLLVDMLLHMTVMPITLPENLTPSIFVRQGILGPAAGIGLLVTLLAYATVFLWIQQNLPGTRLSKGLAYGTAFTGLWLFGFIESSVLFETTFIEELSNWLPDGLTLFILALALGHFTAQDSPVEDSGRTGKEVLSALMIAAAYFIGRYAAYWIADINHPYAPPAVDEFLWTVGMSIWMAIMYLLIGKGAIGKTPLLRAWIYAGVIIGTDWLLFNLFALILFDLPLLEPALRAIFDCVIIGAGMMLSQTGRLSFKPVE